MEHKESEPQEALEDELESGLKEARHDSFMKFPEQIKELIFFGNMPRMVNGSVETEYDSEGLSESKMYDTPFKDLNEHNQYSEKRSELTEREFLRIMYQAAADVGCTREWLQEMDEKVKQLHFDEYAQYREALKKIYLVLRRQGFSNNDIVEYSCLMSCQQKHQ